MNKFLEKYKTFLSTPPGIIGEWCNRYNTFSKSFELFSQMSNPKLIVELGTTRSYVGGHLEGCMSSDDKYWNPNKIEDWDWSAGCFTILAAEFCNKMEVVEFITVDISEEHLKRSKKMTNHLCNNIKYINNTSEEFLSSCNQKIDFLYIDTGNPDLYTKKLQLREAKIIVERNLISENGIILIDDVYRPNHIKDSEYVNKSELSLPYYLLNGFELVYSEYQTILVKK